MLLPLILTLSKFAAADEEAAAGCCSCWSLLMTGMLDCDWSVCTHGSGLEVTARSVAVWLTSSNKGYATEKIKGYVGPLGSPMVARLLQRSEPWRGDRREKGVTSKDGHVVGEDLIAAGEHDQSKSRPEVIGGLLDREENDRRDGWDRRRPR